MEYPLSLLRSPQLPLAWLLLFCLDSVYLGFPRMVIAVDVEAVCYYSIVAVIVYSAAQSHSQAPPPATPRQ